MTEDEKTAALAWAKLAFEAWLVSGASVMSAKANSARALLDAVRLILAMEHVAGECPHCEGFYCGDAGCEDYGVTEHKADCDVDSWVRAAQRAGVE